MEHDVRDVEVLFTHPTNNGGEVMFRFNKVHYMMKFDQEAKGVNTTFASELNGDPIVSDESMQALFLRALGGFMNEHTDGEFKFCVKDPKEVFLRGVSLIDFSYDEGWERYLFQFAGVQYTYRRLVSEGADHIYHRSSGCSCGKATGRCNNMEEVREWVWEGIRKNRL